MYNTRYFQLQREWETHTHTERQRERERDREKKKGWEKGRDMCILFGKEKCFYWEDFGSNKCQCLCGYVTGSISVQWRQGERYLFFSFSTFPVSLFSISPPPNLGCMSVYLAVSVSLSFFFLSVSLYFHPFSVCRPYLSLSLSLSLLW